MPEGIIKFAEFELDCNRYEVLRAGRRIKLEKLPMELLIFVVEKNGHLVTRRETVDRPWGKDPRFQDLVRRVGLPQGKPQT